LNSLSAVVLDDYYRKLRPQTAEARHLLFSRVTVLIAGVLGVGLAMAMTRIHSMADAAFEFVSLVGGGVLGMYLLGLVAPRCTARALHIGIAWGVAFAVWANFCGAGKTALGFLPRFPLHTLWVGLISNVVVFVVGYLAGFFIHGARNARVVTISHDQHKPRIS
jgi:SSS family solute:Na+ symporter